ncbi:MAG: acyl-CoA synthetase [Burkholderiales bacterium]
MHPSHHARTQPDKLVYLMAGSGKTLTYRRLDEASNRGAQLLRSLGLKPGDHMALLFENSLHFFELCWAAQRSGIYYTAISTYLVAEEIAYIAGDCGAKLLVVSDALKPLAEKLAPLLPAGTARFMLGAAAPGWASWDAALAAQPATPIPDEIVGYDMLYSSGTTGRPKGVKPQFKSEPLGTVSPLLQLLVQKMCGFGEQSVYLSPAPLYHAAPLRFNMMVGALGGTAVIMEKFDPEEYLRLVEKHRCTQTQLVPTMFVRMLKLPDDVRARYDVSSLKAAVHAAAPCPVEVKEKMIDWWGPIFIEYYAGTEGNGVTIANTEEWLAHRGTVGRSLVGQIRIVGAHDAQCPTGEVGQVYFAGGPEFAYHNDPVKTKGAYNAQGWSSLGDVGYLDADGYLYLTDRRAYMIISGGVNIYPQEAENVLVNHPAVTDVAVFGVPDDEMGETVKAVVQASPGFALGQDLAEELIAHCRAHLSPIKCPKSIDFRAELPRTPTGKLLKRILRDEYWPKQG